MPREMTEPRSGGEEEDSRGFGRTRWPGWGTGAGSLWGRWVEGRAVQRGPSWPWGAHDMECSSRTGGLASNMGRGPACTPAP